MTNEQIIENAKYRFEKDIEAFSEQTPERRSFVFSAHPEIKEAFSKTDAASSALLGACAGLNSPRETIEALRIKYNLALSDLRTLLISAGYAPDLLDYKPRCGVCHDTGYVNTAVCSCFERYVQEERRKALSSLLSTGNEDFNNFSLKYYNEYSGHMAIILETAKHVAYKFDKNSKNLYFYGATGLGKTFLSACIARVVADGGFTVVYDGFTSIMSNAEGYRFGRGDRGTDLQERYAQYFDCDLLIIDDLGSEMTTAFTISVLYDIINSRLLSDRKTIISSNLSPEELTFRYNDKIASRICGEFEVLHFDGEDIRAQKKNI
ncbi:MAG: ATP-binding protein [Oscillospiraceae bacterium]|jgi:DNA replication protein DnaC|nr:ATP-binding protein [Oscillospiraceae bacterium]